MRALMKVVLLAACVLAVSGVNAAGSARRDMSKGPGMREARFERLAEFLDLTDAQAEQLKKLREENLPRMADLRRDLLRVRTDIRREMLEDSPDVSALKKLAARKGEIRAEIGMARLEQRLAMREILTQEQRDKMFMRRGRGMRGRPSGGAPGFGPGLRRRFGRGLGRGIGFDEMGPGPDSGGPGLGMVPDGPDMGCLGLGPDPYSWCEE